MGAIIWLLFVIYMTHTYKHTYCLVVDLLQFSADREKSSFEKAEHQISIKKLMIERNTLMNDTEKKILLFDKAVDDLKYERLQKAVDLKYAETKMLIVRDSSKFHQVVAAGLLIVMYRCIQVI